MAAKEFGFVYFLYAPAVQRIKIGTGVCPEERLQAIRLMCPVPTELLGMIPGGRKREAELHQEFDHLRRHGEWFEASAELQKEIQVLCLTATWDAASATAREQFLIHVLNTAEMLSEHIPKDKLRNIVRNLHTAGASSIANALTNITGESIMDRRFGA